MDSLDALFCHIDDFCQQLEAQWHQRLVSAGTQRRQWQRSLSLSEILTILVSFHRQQYRNFKAYYCQHGCVYWRSAFPGRVSYQRFVAWMPSALLPLCMYLKHWFGTCTGISFIDSSSLKVCHNRRIQRHKVFQSLAARGKTSVVRLRRGKALWFFGFKLHLVVNDRGELLNIPVTPGNTDDRKPVDGLLKDLYGKVFADRGYVSKALAQRLFESYGIEFFANYRQVAGPQARHCRNRH